MHGKTFGWRVLIVSISVALFEASVVLFVNSATATSEHTYGRFQGVVLHGCYDGDTCTFTIPGVHPLLGDRIGVRLRGIDTPEIPGKCEEEKALARKARDRLEELLKAAKRIDLVSVARGKYFRIVADVEADGVKVVGVLLREGLGRRYDGVGARRLWCKRIAAPLTPNVTDH